MNMYGGKKLTHGGALVTSNKLLFMIKSTYRIVQITSSTELVRLKKQLTLLDLGACSMTF